MKTKRYTLILLVLVLVFALGGMVKAQDMQVIKIASQTPLSGLRRFSASA
jgi:hypothetical protein